MAIKILLKVGVPVDISIQSSSPKDMSPTFAGVYE